jgi:hypothetical protein
MPCILLISCDCAATFLADRRTTRPVFFRWGFPLTLSPPSARCPPPSVGTTGDEVTGHAGGTHGSEERLKAELPPGFNVIAGSASIYPVVPEKPIREFRDGDAFDLKPIEGTVAISARRLERNLLAFARSVVPADSLK